MSKGRRKRNWLRYALAGLLGVVLINEFRDPSGIGNLLRLRRILEEQESQKQALHRRIEELKLERERLESDSGYLEEIARKELGMAHPDEKVFRYVPSSPQETEGR